MIVSLILLIMSPMGEPAEKFAVPTLNERLVQSYLAGLRSPDVETRDEAADSLWFDFPRNNGVLYRYRHILRKSLTDPSEIVRFYISIILGEQKDLVSLPKLIQMLQHDESNLVRCGAAQAITSFRHLAKGAFPILISLLGDDENDELEIRVRLAIAYVTPSLCSRMIGIASDKNQPLRKRRGAILTIEHFLRGLPVPDLNSSCRLLSLLNDKELAPLASRCIGLGMTVYPKQAKSYLEAFIEDRKNSADGKRHAHQLLRELAP